MNSERPDDSDPDLENMSEAEFEHFLAIAIEGYADAMGVTLHEASTYLAAGVLTVNKGLVVRIGDAEFQITIVRSR